MLHHWVLIVVTGSHMQIAAATSSFDECRLMYDKIVHENVVSAVCRDDAENDIDLLQFSQKLQQSSAASGAKE